MPPSHPDFQPGVTGMLSGVTVTCETATIRRGMMAVLRLAFRPRSAPRFHWPP